MRNLLKQLKKGSREIRLTVEEKSVMRRALVQFARENPIMHTAEAKHSRAVVSPYSFMRKARGFKIVSATVIGGILIGGTVSFAAEGALPGNMLYPVKTEVNERVRSMVAVTPQAKAVWEVALVERRLSEMKEVGLMETVPLETKEVARANVKKYTERAQKRIVELDDNNDDDDDEEVALIMAENLARILQIHETMLLEDIDKNTDEDDEELLRDDDNDNDNDGDKKNNIEVKKSSTLKKESERVRATVPMGTSSLKVKNTVDIREREKRQDEDHDDDEEDDDTDSERRKKRDTKSLEKTVDDIREVRENLEKRNRERKAEYERRKETRKEEEEKDTDDEERKTYISIPSSESER